MLTSNARTLALRPNAQLKPPSVAFGSTPRAPGPELTAAGKAPLLPLRSRLIPGACLDLMPGCGSGGGGGDNFRGHHHAWADDDGARHPPTQQAQARRWLAMTVVMCLFLGVAKIYDVIMSLFKLELGLLQLPASMATVVPRSSERFGIEAADRAGRAVETAADRGAQAVEAAANRGAQAVEAAANRAGQGVETVGQTAGTAAVQIRLGMEHMGRSHEMGLRWMAVCMGGGLLAMAWAMGPGRGR